MRKIRNRDILNPREIAGLLAAIKPEGVRGVRDRAIVELLFATGMWVSELIRLRITDLLFDEMCVFVDGRKVPLDSRAYSALDFYIEAVQPKDFLFVSFSRGNSEMLPLTRQGVWKIIRQYGASAGIKKPISPEMIRNTFAVNYLRSGGEVTELQGILGHKDIESTMVYQGV